MDFVDIGKCTASINSTIEEESDRKIKDVVKLFQIVGSTVVGISACYFSGNWEYPFEKERTAAGTFYVGEDETILVQYMYVFNQFNTAYLEELDATAVELKYKNSDLSFVILLPHRRTGLTALEKRLKSYDFSSIHDQMVKDEIEVIIPKFEASFQIPLKNVLDKMGLSSMTISNSDLNDFADKIFVGNVVHKSVINVNEFGTTAADPVAYESSLCSSKLVFHADHSFLYYIIDTAQMCPLFIGSFKTVYKGEYRINP